MFGTIDKATLLSHLGHWSRGRGPLYVQLAQALHTAIERGDLPPLTMLPPERSFARALSVSRGTVMAAYDILRAADLVESRRGSGSWVRLEAARPAVTLNDERVGRAAPIRAFERLFDDRSELVDLITCSPPDLRALGHGLLAPPSAATIKALIDGDGDQPHGLFALRRAVADQFEDTGLRTDPTQVAITGGAQQALSLVASLVLKPGDAVIVESPTYPGALETFARAGSRIVSVPTERASVSTRALRDAIERHAPRLIYLMPDGHNPLGHVMNNARRREIALLADQYELFIMEDNTLSPLVLTNSHTSKLAAFSEQGRVLSVGSLSKVAWAALRIGWIRGPEWFIDRLGRLKAVTDGGCPDLTQLAALQIFDELPELSRARVGELNRHLQVLEAGLRRVLPTWSWLPPEAGALLWVRLPQGDAHDFAHFALRYGVEVASGANFTGGRGASCHIAISYAQPPNVLQHGVDRLATAWRAYCHSNVSSPCAARAV